jgi:hypothetical protein
VSVTKTTEAAYHQSRISAFPSQNVALPALPTHDHDDEARENLHDELKAKIQGGKNA